MKRQFNIVLLAAVLLVSPSGCGLLTPATYDTTKYQAVHQAALDGDNATIKELLQANPSLVNIGDYDKNTPLHLAAMHGHADTAKLLLDDGANVNALNTAGMTALHLAAKAGFLDVVKVLVNAKPDLSIKDSRGWTALVWAENAHHDDIATFLKENGAKE
jgi:uncharacterized protein